MRPLLAKFDAARIRGVTDVRACNCAIPEFRPRRTPAFRGYQVTRPRNRRDLRDEHRPIGKSKLAKPTSQKLSA